MTRWRLSSQAAHRWLTEADLLAPRQSFTGEPLHPELPATAAATALGLLTDEHVTVHPPAMRRLPAWVDLPTAPRSKWTGSATAWAAAPRNSTHKPTKPLFLLDQDGPVPTTPNAAAAAASPRNARTPSG